MGWVKSLKALAISEERRLAGQLAGLMYLCGAMTAPLVLLLPGVERDYWYVVVGISVVGALWGLSCLFVVPWERAHPLVSHLSASGGFPITAAAVAATGGRGTPARFYLLYIVVYCGYFY